MDLKILQQTILFRRMDEPEIRDSLETLMAQEKQYSKGETVFHAGTTTDRMGLVLEGSVTIESNDM